MTSHVLALYSEDSINFPNPLYNPKIDVRESEWMGRKMREGQNFSKGMELDLKDLTDLTKNNQTSLKQLLVDIEIYSENSKKVQYSIASAALSFQSPSSDFDSVIYGARDNFLQVSSSGYNSNDLTAVKFAISYIANSSYDDVRSKDAMEKTVTKIYEKYLENKPIKSFEIAKYCIGTDSELASSIIGRCWHDLINDHSDLAWQFAKAMVGSKKDIFLKILEHALEFLLMDISRENCAASVQFLIAYVKNKMDISDETELNLSLKNFKSTLNKLRKIKTENEAIEIVKNRFGQNNQTCKLIVTTAKVACEAKEIKLTNTWEEAKSKLL